MSKKKNTLRDLDEFLKQQAATLVSPAPLQQETEVQRGAEVTHLDITPEKLIHDINVLAAKGNKDFRTQLYEVIIRSLESQTHPLPEDMMLINTALYLKHGANWKDAIREYWQKKA